MTHYLATVRDALASAHPSLPWIVLALAIFLVQYGVRRWCPSLWLWAFRWIPEDLPAVFRNAIQSAPSLFMGLALPSLASGGDLRHAFWGTLAGTAAPVAHHLLKAVPFLRYRGQLGKYIIKPPTIPPVLPLLLLVGALLTVPHVTACSPQQPAQTALVQRAGVVAFESSVAAYAIALDAETRRVEELVTQYETPTPLDQEIARSRLERLERVERALLVARAWLSGEASDADGKRAIGDAATLLVVLLEELLTQRVPIPRYVIDGARAAQAFAAAGGAL